ncbi:transglutaminase domain-containing protein, partial [Candidatus Woesearchaeota archaeon]|nr:transglutaminase domain-containing protein [Candidatus Woesearchaeota archaeon]
MKRLLIACLLLFIFSSVTAQESPIWVFDSSYLVLDTTIKGNVLLKKETSQSFVDFVALNVTFFPRETENQEILSEAMRPVPKESNEQGVAFFWQSPQGTVLDFSLQHQVKVQNDFPKIIKKISFPIRQVPSAIEPYLRPQAIIDSDDERISALASKIVEGEDDLYLTVHKLAVWTVENIAYNLSTVTAKASKSATWVLENKQGVCDELTALFIAMARSIGIPARFVSGISYTSSPLFPERWGPHGWAEIYFPGYGWVPFDVTYEEFGYVDPTHVIAKYSLDAGETSLQYAWRGRDVDAATGDLKITANVLEQGALLSPDVSFEVNLLKEKTGLGGYNAVEVVMKNLRNYYQSAMMGISRTTKLEMLGERKQYIALKPGEEKRIYWILKLEEGLDEEFLYTFPLTVHTDRGMNKTMEFAASKHNHLFSLQEIQALIQQRQKEEEKTYSAKLQVQCTMDKEEYY